MRATVVAGALLLALAGRSGGADYPEPVSADYAIKDFRFHSGEVLPELRIHYRTVGQPPRTSIAE